MSLLLPAVPALPLLAALLTIVLDPRGVAVRALALLAPLPAVALYAFAPTGAEWHASSMLSGLSLQADEPARLISLVSGLVWLGATLLRWRPARSRFTWACLHLTMAGNLTVLVAADVIVFYTAFALMSFAAYGLIVESGSDQARRAGRLYIGFVVTGELLLFAGLVLATSDGAYRIDALAPAGNTAGALFLLALGIKCGLVPVHAALPVTYRAASAPVALALAGALLNAGLMGWLRLLPATGAGPEFWQAMQTLGLLTLVLGAIIGLAQREPRALLAYSTITQAGLIAIALAAAAARGAQASDALAAYVAHHALVKGALVALAGVALAKLRGPTALVAWLAVGAAAFGLAGMPLTGGYAMKNALLTIGLDERIGYASTAVSAMLAMRLVQLARRSTARTDARLTVVVGTALAALALAMPLLSGLPAGGLGAGSLVGVLVASTAAGAVMLADRWIPERSWPAWPPGDLLVALLERTSLKALRARAAALTAKLQKDMPQRALQRWLRDLDRFFATVEQALGSWGVITALLGITALLMLAVGFG